MARGWIHRGLRAGLLALRVLVGLLVLRGEVASGQEPRASGPASRTVAPADPAARHAAELTKLWEAAAASPRDADLQNRLGEALERMGALDAAVEAFERAVDARPSFRKASNNLILTLVKAGRGPAAVSRARALADAAPGDAERQFTLALALSEQDVEAALAAFRRVIQIDPRHALAHVNLALVLKRADRMPEAIDALQRALAIEDRAQAHYQLGVLYWQQGDAGRAVSELRAAVAGEPGYADAYYTLGAVLADRGDPGGAERALRQAIALRPDLAGAYDTLGRVLRQAGREQAAATAFADAEGIRRRLRLEQEAGVWTAVGSQRLAAGDLTGALDQFRRATAVFDGYAPAHYQTGIVLRRLGEPEAARGAFARAAQLNPGLVPPSGPP